MPIVPREGTPDEALTVLNSVLATAGSRRGRFRPQAIRGQRYPITYWGLGSQKERTWAKAGVEGRWHDLRHTAGRRHTRANGNLKLTQTLLGHSDIKTTADFYEDVLVDELRQAMEKTAEAAVNSRAALRAAKAKYT